MECKYAVKTGLDKTQIINLQHFPLYFDCQANHYEVDLLGKSTFKPIPYSSWIKNNTQQQLYSTNLFPLIEKEKLVIILIYQDPQI